MDKDRGRSVKSNRFQDSYILQAWLCIVLALLFGASLAGVQAALGPIIAANKINETKERVPELLLGQKAAENAADPAKQLTITPRSVTVEKKGGPKSYSVFEARYANGQLAGWVTRTQGQGYADRIELLIGLDPSAHEISGIFILDQKETPGLGNRIAEPQWSGQFAGKPTDRPLKVVKTGASGAREIDAVSGATISSGSVIAIVNQAVADLKRPLGELARK